MRKPGFAIQNWLFFSFLCCAVSVLTVSAQSTRLETPTPIVSNELSGKIAARDIGDSRLTTYYYAFNGNQGDIFLRIQSANLNGDIDVFYAENMRPLTKISLYSDSANEIAREIYLRKPEKLILRVEGRSPNDDAATFSIKFDGSFQALAPTSSENDETPRIKNEVAGAVRVNSVGTIIEPVRKPEAENTTAAANDNPISKKTAPKKAATVKVEKDENAESENLNRRRVVKSTESKNKSNDEIPAEKNAAARIRTTARRPLRTAIGKTAKTKAPVEKKTAKNSSDEVKSVAEMKTAELNVALENVRLVVLMKDGEKIDRPMSDILRFSVDKGMLTIISKRGAISRYSILDVSKVSIE